MERVESLPLGAPGYRALGLFGNPFLPPDADAAVGAALTTHAAGMRLMVALDQAAAEERSKPVWVVKPDEVVPYYIVLALAEVLESLTAAADVGVVPVYVQMQTMKKGRIRAALAATAEKVAGVRFEHTLAAWCADVLSNPDTTLDEWGALSQADLSALRERLRVEPEAVVSELFGPCETFREGVREDLEMMLRVSTARQERQELDPEATEETDEDDLTDPAAEAFTQRLVDEEELPSAETPDGSAPEAAAVVAYVVAHTRKHLSPVVARGLRAYVAQGTASMVEEWKVTKAPRKTLGAVARFACAASRKVAVIWDRLDPWDMMDSDQRLKVATAITEIRWALADSGILVVLAAPGQAPELEEQFGGATRVVWDMPGIERVERSGAAFDAEVAAVWTGSAALPGSAPLSVSDGPLAALVTEAAGSLEVFATAACATVDSAAARGDGMIGDEDVAVGLAAAAAAAGDGDQGADPGV